MQVEVDQQSGFCPGVVSAIRKAEEQLARQGTLYCLGDIVHNNEEVTRLGALGLITIDHQQLSALRDTRILLRAHGEPPSTYQLAAERDIEVVDATCPVVLALQRKIKQVFESEPGVQIVIYGKQGHAEVNGLVGQTQGQAIVVEGEQDLHKIDPQRPVRLFSQTTMPVDTFRQLAATLCRRMSSREDFRFEDTICRQVSNRIPHLREFAVRHDVVLFVSGKKSSNGRALFDVCLQANARSYFVSHPDDVTPEMLSGAQSVGICGATSTPRWQMEAIMDKIAPMAEQ